MDFYGESLYQAFSLIISADKALAEVFWLSVKVSFTALLIACALGLPRRPYPTRTRQYTHRCGQAADSFGTLRAAA